ncbi:MAG: hypothetical protein J5584_09170 [Clostridia bacterium]|nr:hypothetical protein [Clostridia bacterium]
MKKVFAVLTALMLLAGMMLSALPAAAAEPLEIVNGPSNYVVPEGMNVMYSVNATGSDLSYEWFLRYQGADYPLMDTPETISASWHDYIDGVTLSPTGADITLENVKLGLDGAKIYCIVNGSGSVAVTGLAHISVQKVTKTTLKHITKFAVKHVVNTTLDKLVKIPVKITEESGYDYAYQWYETHDGTLEHIQALLYENEMVLIPDTSKTGTKYYVCMVEVSKGGQKLYGYTEVCRVNVRDPNEDSALTSGVDLQKEPNKKTYKGGEAIDLSGIRMRVYSEQGFWDLTDKSKISVYPNNVYSSEQKRLVVEYDGFAAQYNITVSGGASAGSSFSIYPVSEQHYYTYIPHEAFSLEAAAKNANGEVTFKWYESNEKGERKELYAEGSRVDFPNGLYIEEATIHRYYLCVATCDGKEDSLLFSALLIPPDYNPPDDPTNAPTSKPTDPPTAVPATAVPATEVPATAAPATQVPGGDATAVPGDYATAEPGVDVTPEPGDDVTAEPGGDATAVPGGDATTVPGGSSGKDKDNGKNAEIIKGVIIAGGILGAAVIIGVFMLIISKKK